MKVLSHIAMRHLMARQRQTLVSLSGIVIGVAFFLAISSMMRGSQNDFIKRMVDNSPHITISDDYRSSSRQPLEMQYPDNNSAIEIRSVKPLSVIRGIRGYKQIISDLRSMPGVRASATLTGQALLNYAGQEINVTLNGMVPSEILEVTTTEANMIEGSVYNLISNRGGIIVGAEMIRRLNLGMGDNITLTSSVGQTKVFKIVGVFRTGRGDYDRTQAFVDLKRVQAMMNRPDRANSIIIKLDDPQIARDVAHEIEIKHKYKAESWQERTEDLMNTFAIRNTIMFSVVSAVLIVAAFGIYNIISTVVMEKSRDIAILKSMGFTASDIKRIFLTQGFVMGCAGVALGLPLGCILMLGLLQIKLKMPGQTLPIQMPLDWSISQFAIAAAFAMGASVLAAWLPARKGAKIMPVDILRGGQ